MTSEESCLVDVTMVDPVDLSPDLSPKMSDLTLSDYYTIATVLDQSPDDRNNTLTSFSNPNYGLDAINSNLFVTSSYDDDVTDGKATEAGDVTEASDVTRPQKKDSRGGQGSEDSKRQRTASEDEGEDTDRGQEIEDGVSQKAGNVGNANETGETNTTTTTTTATAKTTNLKADRKGQSLFQDIYSPDSNDSGIQADVPQTRHHSPSDLNNASSSSSSSSSSSFSSSSSKDEDRVAVENVNNIAKDSESKEASSIGDVIYHCGGDGAPPSKQRSAPGGEGEKHADPKVTDNPSNEPLPYGWQKHEDISGAYYWHIKSGTIQREPPSAYQCEAANQNLSKNSTSDSSIVDEPVNPRTNQMDAGTPSSRSGAREDRADDVAETAAAAYPMRFAVRSLGWVQISEDDLTPERSSRSVNKCIVGLSLGRNDLNDVVGRWGDGKSLYMELDEENLVLIDPQDMCLLNIQPIQSIRVWGVGRSNGRERDFAYVARDSITHKYMCHVFRCDGLARHIAGALRDVCKKILTEKSTGLVRHQRPGSSSSSSFSSAGGGGGLHHGGSSAAAASGIIRPNNLPNLERIRDPPNGQHFTFDSLYKNTSFPTPMEEPKKVLRCHYLGTTQVLKPTGVEILNNAIESVYMRLPPDKWTYVNVAVAPSTITIIEHGKPENVFAECRVRFLSFMGIAMNNIRLCSYIMHCAEDQFIAHIFHCDPSAGALCKTIEAACKLRYQKCLDAHLRCRPFNKTPAQTRQAKGIGLSIRHSVQNIIGNLTKGCKPKS